LRYASIDIGTNTLRLLIADVEDNRVRPIYLKRVITRLGGGYREDTGIDPVSARRTVEALIGFARTAKEYDVACVKAVATSVVRRARNREDFLNEVLKRAGLMVEVISGDEEARLALLGVLSVIGNTNKHCLVIDIGGGSTEFIATVGGMMMGVWSMEMGVVHLTEDYLRSESPAVTELRGMEKEIEGMVDNLKGLMEKDGINPGDYSSKAGAILAGTAGTVTTLAALDQGLEIYDPKRINNYILTYNAVKRMYEWLASLTLGEREKILSLERGREDLIIPGSAIVLKAMEAFGFDRMTVSDAGLLEGILLNQLSVTSGQLSVNPVTPP